MSRPVAATVAILVLVGVLWAARDSQPGLAVQHALQTSLMPDTTVTTLVVDGVGDVALFLNPDDNVITPRMRKGLGWEETETHWFVRSLRSGDVVVDVGANIGYYTLLAGRLVGEGGRVYAFEPDPFNFAILQRNVRLAGLRNVVLEQKAVSNEPGSIRLFLSESNKGDHRIYQPEGERRESVEVEAVDLDAYFAGVEEQVDFVKIDTQGAELVILQGMRGILKDSDALVMAVEYSPRHLAGFDATADQLLEIIGGFGASMFDLGMGGPEVRPVRPVTPEQLRRRYSPLRKSFTNLLLVKNRPDVLAAVEEQIPPP